MDYRDCFTLGLIGIVLGIMGLIICVFLWFSLDIPYIIRLFIKKLKIVILVIIAGFSLSGMGYAMEDTMEISMDFYYISKMNPEVTIRGTGDINDVEKGNSIVVIYEEKAFDIYDIPDELTFIMYDNGEFEISGIGSETSEYGDGLYEIYRVMKTEGEEERELITRAMVIKDMFPPEIVGMESLEGVYNKGDCYFIRNREEINFKLNYIEKGSGIDAEKSYMKINEDVCPVEILNDEIIFLSEDVSRFVKSGYNNCKWVIIDLAGNKSEFEFTVVLDTEPPRMYTDFGEDTLMIGENLFFKSKEESIGFELRGEDNEGIKEAFVRVNGEVLIHMETEKFPIPVNFENYGGFSAVEIIIYDYAGNEVRKIFNVIKDIEAPVVNMENLSVMDAKGVVGLNKRFRAFFTGEDTVVVSIAGVYDAGVGMDSVVFIYENEGKEVSIRAKYDENRKEYYGVFNIPKNAKREFRIISRDRLGNVWDSYDNINIYNDSYVPEIKLSFDGKIEPHGKKTYYKNLKNITVCVSDAVGIRNVSVNINGKVILEEREISEGENLLREKSIEIKGKDLQRGESIIEIVAENYGGVQGYEKWVMVSDNSAPGIENVKIDGKNTMEITGKEMFLQDRVRLSFSVEDRDDSGNVRGEEIAVSVEKFSFSGDNLGEIKINSKNGYECYIDTGFRGYLKIKAEDEFGNLNVFITGRIYAESLNDFTESTEIVFYEEGGDVYNKKVNLNFSVKSEFSGIREVTYELMAPNDIKENSKGTVNLTNQRMVNSLVTYGEGSISINNNSNDISVKIKVTDNANRSYEKSHIINIDKTQPKIELSLKDGEWERYFNRDVATRLVITERNFHEENLDLEVFFRGKRIERSVSFRKIKNENPDENMYISDLLFTEEGDYKIRARVEDSAGNSAGIPEREFVIDKSRPICSITMDKAENEGGYINEKVTAKIRIREDNFREDLIEITGENIRDKLPFIFENGEYVSYVSFRDSGECRLQVKGKDLAGNLMETVNIDKFILDLISPSVLIHNLTNGISYNDKLDFEIVIKDENLDFDNSGVSLVSKSNSTVPKLSLEKAVGEIRFSSGEIPVLREYDGVYLLEIDAVDLGGNRVEKSLSFSLNRFGSVFALSKDSENINNRYLQTISHVGVKEINYDEINPDKTRVFLFRNGETYPLKKDVDYRVSAEKEEFLNSLKYEIDKDNFKEDGVYALSVYSEDGAGNANQSQKDFGLLTFVVDRTSPRVYLLDDLEEDLTGQTQGRAKSEIKIRAFDNMKLDRLEAFDGNVPLDIESFDEKYSVHLSENTNSVRLVAVDAAGNETEDIIYLGNPNKEKKRFPEKLDLFILSVSGVLCIILVLWIRIYLRKRKTYFLLRLLRDAKKY